MKIKLGKNLRNYSKNHWVLAEAQEAKTSDLACVGPNVFLTHKTQDFAVQIEFTSRDLMDMLLLSHPGKEIQDAVRARISVMDSYTQAK